MRSLKQSIAFVLAVALVLACVMVVPSEASAAGVDTYLASCTEYPSHFTVKTRKAIPLMTYPCDTATNSGSTTAATVVKGTVMMAKNLYLNPEGEYWYSVERYGKTYYVNAANIIRMDHMTGDVTISGVKSPAGLGLGQSFGIAGTITAKNNELGTITAAMYSKTDLTKTPVIQASDTPTGSSYSLSGSTIDNNLVFGDLSRGDYTYIVKADAISYYIDDYGKLTKSTKNVVLETKQCIVTDVNNPNAVTAKGIDVSEWQDNIDWAKVATQVDFAILRASFGVSDMDGCFIQNADGCTNNGIPFGVYVYSYATTVAGAKQEAEYVLSCLRGYDLALPVYYDVEDESQASLSASQKLALVQAFAEVIEAGGYEPGLYSFLSWFQSYFYDSYYKSLPTWVAQIDSQCSHTGGVRMWQYSWTGSFDGISGDVDCNYYYGEFPGKKTDTSYLSKCTYYSTNMMIKNTNEVIMKKYPCDSSVDSGSTDIKTVAAGSNLHATALYKNSAGEYWYQVIGSHVCGYIPAANTTVSSYLFSDVAVIDPTMATNLSVGSGYAIAGEVRSQHNLLTKVSAKVYKGENTLGTPVLNSNKAVSTRYFNLKNSVIDENLLMNELEAGYYTYEISADFRCYYIDTAGALKSRGKTLPIWTAPLTVGSSTISHSHTSVTDAAVAPTCTATGLSAGSHCSECGQVITAQTVVAAKGHTPGTAVVENEVAGVSYDEVVYCTVCNAEISRKTVTVTVTPEEPDPVITPKYPTLSLEGEVRYNVYYTVENFEDIQLTDMGLLTWSTKPSDGTYDNAEAVVPGALYDSTTGYYMVQSEGIAAKNLGDNLYFKVYAKQADGSYVYSSLNVYNAKYYAEDRLANSSNADLKAACVALLNYGAEAQTYFDYKTDALVNRDLTAAQKALIKTYDASMMDAVVSVDSSKVGTFCTATGGFTKGYPSTALEGAFMLNYYFAPKYAMDGNMTLYFWDMDAYTNAETLTAQNAVLKLTAVASTVTEGEYSVCYEGIPAGKLDETLFVCAVYQSGGVRYCTGVIPYSLGAYCVDRANNGTEKMKPLAEDIAVYGYYAKAYIASLT